MSKYEVVIGIETHVQLATKTKLFCNCDNDSRDVEPNTNVCPVCLGYPGALPVLNGAAVELALRAGHALNAFENPKPYHTKFDRKNYFYPDSPMNYQITQFDEPIIGNGSVSFPVGGEQKTVRITRAHLEADAGKLIHPAGKDYSLVDLNRAGTPLIEIVSEPDMRSAAEAKAYTQELYNLMRYAQVSDANLYYGNMRFDVNVSLRPIGATEFGTRTESKNLNSFRAVSSVVEYETMRQAELLDAGEKVVQETRGWDEAKGITVSQRSKEEAHDYRYFPEPDLPPLEISLEMIKTAQHALPANMPGTLRDALQQAGIPSREAEALISDQVAAELWSETVQAYPQHARFALNWLVGGRIKLEETTKTELNASNVNSQVLGTVATMVADGKLSSTNAKLLLAELWLDTRSPEDVAEALGLIQNSDTGAIEAIVDTVIAANPGPVEQYRAGETKIIGFLVGQVMKQSKGQANPPMVNDILKKKLGA